MTVPEVIIVGAGQAGFQVAASLRQDGFDGRIVMFGDEPYLPYQRPPLSKTFLTEGNPERLNFRKADFFSINRIEIELSTRIASIDPAEGAVTTQAGPRHRFDHLVLATGARNRKLPLAGLNAANVFEMRTLADAIGIRDRLDGIESVVIIGGGFIGLEFAAVARQLGKHVVIVEAQGRLMSRAVSAPISGYFLTAHRSKGIDVRLGQTVAAVETDSEGTATAVILGGGERIACNAILVAAGVVPNSELASDAGLHVDNGIVVDGMMQTSSPNISAVGDCVSFPAGAGLIRLESVQNAADQARCVSKRITGSPEPYEKLPWFWSDQGNDKLQIAGLVDRANIIVPGPANEPGRISVFGFSGSELCSVETINAPGDHMSARKILSGGNRPTLRDLEACGFKLKDIRPNPGEVPASG